MEDEDRTKVLEGKNVKEIANLCNRYPVLSLEYKLGERKGEDLQVMVGLVREEELEQ